MRHLPRSFFLSGFLKKAYAGITGRKAATINPERIKTSGGETVEQEKLQEILERYAKIRDTGGQELIVALLREIQDAEGYIPDSLHAQEMCIRDSRNSYRLSANARHVRAFLRSHPNGCA